MSYEQAFDALKDGDFITAVPLIEEAARENGYTADVINHACNSAKLVGMRERIAPGRADEHRNRRPFAENRRILRSTEPGHSRSFSFAIRPERLGERYKAFLAGML